MAPRRSRERAPRIQGFDYPMCLCKETDVSNVKTSTEQGTRVEKPELLDCGQATKVTKGSPWFFLPEGSPPPFNRLLF